MELNISLIVRMLDNLNNQQVINNYCFYVQVAGVICDLYVVQLTYGVQHTQVTTWQKEKGALKGINYLVQRFFIMSCF